MTIDQLESKFSNIQLKITDYSDFSDEISFNYFKPSLNTVVKARVYVDLKTETPAEKLIDHLASASKQAKPYRNDKFMSEFNQVLKALPFCEQLRAVKRQQNLMLFRSMFPDLEVEDWEDISDEEIQDLANFKVDEVAPMSRLRSQYRERSTYDQFDFSN